VHLRIKRRCYCSFWERVVKQSAVHRPPWQCRHVHWWLHKNTGNTSAGKNFSDGNGGDGCSLISARLLGHFWVLPWNNFTPSSEPYVSQSVKMPVSPTSASLLCLLVAICEPVLWIIFKTYIWAIFRLFSEPCLSSPSDSYLNYFLSHLYSILWAIYDPGPCTIFEAVIRATIVSVLWTTIKYWCTCVCS